LGVQITLVEKGSRLIPSEEELSSQLLIEKLTESISVHLNTQLLEVNSEGEAILQDLSADTESSNKKIKVEAILFAMGRKPRVNNLGLENLELKLNSNGTLSHNDYMQTQYPNIFVCGDVAGPIQLTHVAGHQAWYATVNALFQPFKKYKQDLSVIPKCIFTTPEVASVGLTEFRAKELNLDFEITDYKFDTFDRAVCEEDTGGFVRILTLKDSDKILGATVVAPRAGEMIMEIALAMRWKLGLKKILSTVHPYPGWSDAIKMAALQWQKNHIPHKLVRVSEKFHDWKRN